MFYIIVEFVVQRFYNKFMRNLNVTFADPHIR